MRVRFVAIDQYTNMILFADKIANASGRLPAELLQTNQGETVGRRVGRWPLDMFAVARHREKNA
jgi:hypothetical protein